MARGTPPLLPTQRGHGAGGAPFAPYPGTGEGLGIGSPAPQHCMRPPNARLGVRGVPGGGVPWAGPRSPPPEAGRWWCRRRAPPHRGTGSRRGTGGCCGSAASWRGPGYLRGVGRKGGKGPGRPRGSPHPGTARGAWVGWGRRDNAGHGRCRGAPARALIGPPHPSGRPSCPAKRWRRGSTADTSVWRPPTAPRPRA